MRLAERGGKNAKRRAAVAVARRLAVLMLSLLKSEETYEPLRLAIRRGEMDALTVELTAVPDSSELAHPATLTAS